MRYESRLTSISAHYPSSTPLQDTHKPSQPPYRPRTVIIPKNIIVPPRRSPTIRPRQHKDKIQPEAHINRIFFSPVILVIRLEYLRGPEKPVPEVAVVF